MDKLKKSKIVILILIDIVLINLSYITAFYFRFMTQVPKQQVNDYIKAHS